MFFVSGIDIAREEKRREGERKGHESREHQETCSSPLEGMTNIYRDVSLRRIGECMNVDA